ncbi:MAG: hypothetical protein NTU98_09755 [Bacteroidetes bacterium]|nr:hypothetical protein [Bacteroidota bacterium]
MKRILPFILVLTFSAGSLFAQTKQEKPAADTLKTEKAEKKPPLIGFTFSGYVKTDIYYDSRQTVNSREGQFLLYPDAIVKDAEGNDINAKSNFNMLSIQTRLAGAFTGPDALKAKTSAYIEGEFFGNTNGAINSFRLRHAWVKLAWTHTELMVGQYWHPMFVATCAPETVSFNTGAPFVVFSRNPQIRVTQSLGHFKLILTALSQLDFTSNGPDGPNPKYLRNSVLPEMDFQVQYGIKNETKGTEFLVGAGVDYILLTPRLSTEVVQKKAYDTVVDGLVVHHNAVTATYRSTETTSGLSFNLFSKLRLSKITLKAGGFYGSNNYAFTMLGGYAVKNISNAGKGTESYSALSTLSTWFEFSTNGKTWVPGLFAAFSKNLGAGETVTGPYYSRGSNIDYLYRISPRLILNIKKFRIAAEIEYTVAAYGKTNEKGYVYNQSEVGNLRGLLGVYFFF